MATSFIKKSMAYLGLVDDYDDYDDYDSRPAPAAGGASRPVELEDDNLLPDRPDPGHPAAGRAGPVAAAPQVAAARPATSRRSRSPRPDAGARVHIVAPARFADAVEIANRLMSNSR